MSDPELDKATIERLLTAQRNEITEYHIYRRLSRFEKGPNRDLLKQLSNEELKHYAIWKSYTLRNARPDQRKIWFFVLLAWLFGISFSLKIMEGGEEQAQVTYQRIASAVPAARAIILDEEKHERELIGLIDEERLKYEGSLMSGLSTATMQITGVLSGLTLALHDSQRIAAAGLLTAASYSLALGGSEFLAKRGDSGGISPHKAAFYAGGSNLVASLFLVWPYAVFGNYRLALGLMLIFAVIVVAVFNYNVAVIKGQRFGKRFTEMLGVTAVVAVMAFAVGYAANLVFGSG